MIFSNINIFSITIICILFVWIWYLYSRIFSQQAHRKQSSIIFAIFLFLLISILWPRGNIISAISQTTWSNIAFVVDVSKSMGALDFDNESISRLQMSKGIISTYIQEKSNNRYALDAFSWDAVKLLPFTNDISIYQTILSWINDSNVGKSWTDILTAIYSSVSHFTENEGGLIVIFTDGWEEEISNLGNIKDVLDEKNIKVLIVWIGSIDWNYIPVGIDFFGRVTYKTYQGSKVLTQLNNDELMRLGKQIWEYLPIPLNWSVKELFQRIDSLSEDVVFESNSDQRRNLVSFFVLLGFIFWLLFLLNICISKYRKK